MNTLDSRLANTSHSTVNYWACATLLVCFSLGLVAASLWAVTKFDYLRSLGCPAGLTMALAIAGVVVAATAFKEAVELVSDRILMSPEQQRAVHEAAARYPAVAEMLKARYPDGGNVSRSDCKRIAEFVRGMVAVGACAPVPEAQAPAAELPPFDYESASKRSFAFVREDGDTLEMVIGRPNWMPVPVAMLLACDDHLAQTAISDLFGQFIRWDKPQAGDCAGRDGQSELTAEQGWLDLATRKLVPEITRIRAQDDARRCAEFDSEKGQDGYSGFTFNEAVFQFVETWYRVNTLNYHMWDVSAARCVAYSRLPEEQALANALEDMRIWSLKWACNWLAESGMQVNHQEQLVLVPGYQPLRLKKIVYGD